VTALDGRVGLELARAHDPDVILLDIIMPGMDGYAVCRQLKADEHLRDIPVVFLTALHTDRESRVKALQAGAEGFLTKPPDELELTAQIKAMARLKAGSRMRRLERDELAVLVAERTRDLEAELGRRTQAEAQVRGQLAELVRWQDVMLGREDRVQQLKREVNDLCRRAGEAPRYPSQDAGPEGGGGTRPDP